MSVGYNKVIAWVLLGVGIVCGLLGVFVLSISPHPGIGQYGPVLTGGICLLNGWLMLSRPLFTLEADRIVVHALIGPVKREFPFSSKRDIRVDGGKLYVGDRKLPVSRGRSNAQDWDKLVAALAFE